MSEKCRKCGSQPTVVYVGGCYYAQCTGCTKFDRWEFLGRTAAGALKAWDAVQISHDVHRGRKTPKTAE